MISKIRLVHALAASIALAVIAAPRSAPHAQTGVSSDRVSLPEGPGSLEGVGENVDIDPNMGLMSYHIPIEVPEGFPGLTPALSLTYSSAGGNSVVGVGWELHAPFIERTSNRGLPRYTDADRFAADGSAQLVRLPGTNPPTFRARHEGGFVRYTWLDRGAGDEGFWKAEWPDGRVGTFGADSNGAAVPEARVSGPRGTFRYHLVEIVDVWGHRLRYDHRKSGNVALLSRVEWAHDDAQRARFAVELDYEGRSDVASDARAGFEERLSERLSGIRVFNNTEGRTLIQRYALNYEDFATSNGVSRLARFERFGANGGLHPAALDFTYSRALGGVCQEEGCERPYLVDMGRLGVNLLGGAVTLVDINGDALPDVIDTTGIGPHRLFINIFRGPRDQSFAPGVFSAVGRGNNHPLRAGNVQLLDVNGDGFTDMLNTLTGQVLANRGTGDWIVGDDEEVGALPDLAGDFDPADGDLRTIRFLDYDNDKRIDIIKSIGAGLGNVTTVFRNTPDGFVIDPDTENIGLGFDSDRLDLADVNGDGLLDPCRLGLGELTYQLNLGLGRWGELVTIEGLPFDEDTLRFVEIEDLNNDGRADLVVVLGGEVRYAMGRDASTFDAPVVLNGQTLGFSIPERDDTTSVLFADMNGSGSTDIVWVDLAGDVSYLELFPVQPHLLAKIQNNLGMIQEIAYGTSVEQAARDANEGRPWIHELPHAMRLVTRVDVYDTLNDLHEITELRYRDGFYDGLEKSFRGYQRVETTSPGDASIEAGRTRLEFDVGDQDAYRAGLRLSQEVFSNDRLLQQTSAEFADCPVDEVPDEGLDFPVRFICQRSLQNVVLEGGGPDQQATSRQDFDYDGFGNLTRIAQRGVVSVGQGQGCAPCQRAPDVFGAPCGPQCLGDELFTEIERVSPANTGGRWILNRPSRVRQYGQEGGDAHEKIIRYDGAPFVGLPEGQLTRGAPTRVQVKRDEGGDLIDELRHAIDDHGRVTEAILPDGDTSIADDQRFRQTFDPSGLTPRTLEYLLKDPDGAPYRLRQRLRYDDVWNRVAEVTQWIVVRGDEELTPDHAESIVYDEFARVIERYLPTDPIDAPSERLTYELGDPISRVITERRTERAGDFDQVSVRCFDGFGRLLQERRQVDEDTWLVSGFVRTNAQGQVFQSWGRYEGDDGACDTTPPVGVPLQEVALDALRRPLRSTLIAGGVRRTRRFEYHPLHTLQYDPEDSDPASPHFDTPTRVDFDGLGRTSAVHRSLRPGEAITTAHTYDALNRYRGPIDPQGNATIQTYDLAGRLVAVDDPDRGLVQIEHDDAGRPVRRTDALGLTIRSEYDALGRLTATWDEANPERSRINHRYDLPASCPASLCANTANKLVESDFPVEGARRGVYWRGYDVHENRVFMSRQLLDQRFDFTWTFDNSGDMIARTFPDGRALTFDRDKAQRLQAIPGVIDAIGFDAASRPDSIQAANGVVEGFEFDDEDRLRAIEVTDPRDALIAARRLTLDGVGNILEVVDGAARPGAPSANVTYRVDALYRLIGAHLDAGRASIDEEITFAYDSIDNMTLKSSSQGQDSPDHVGEMTYGQGAGPHALTQAGDLVVVYDEIGNMTQRGFIAIQHDCFSRVGDLSRGQGLTRTAYGPGQQRILSDDGRSTTWTLGDHYEIRDGVAVIHVEIGDRRVADLRSTALAAEVLSDLAPLDDEGRPAPDGQIDVADALIAARAERNELDLGGLRRDSAQALLRAAAERLLVGGGQTTWFHADHQGNVMALTDEQGAPIDARLYYPYGLPRGPRGDNSPAGFNNQDQDDDFGFVHFDARLLDPLLGRWISPDPLFQSHEGPHALHPAEATSAYAAMNNNPATFRDQDGQSVTPTASLSGLDAALNKLSYKGAGIGLALAGAAFDDDQDAEARASTPDGRSLHRFDVNLHAFSSASRGGIPGYLTAGADRVADLGALAHSTPTFLTLLGSNGVSGQQRLAARQIVTSASNLSISLSTLGALSASPNHAALPLAALGASPPSPGLIANGLTHHDALNAILGGLSKLSAADSRSARSATQSLAQLGIPAGAELQRAFGPSTQPISSSLDQTRAHNSALGAAKGAATGASARRAQTSNTP